MYTPGNIFLIDNPSNELIDIAILNHANVLLLFINLTPIEKRCFTMKVIIKRYEYFMEQIKKEKELEKYVNTPVI
jgi:hypothetical protein